MRVTVSDCTTQCLEPFSSPAKDVCQALSAARRSSSALNKWGFRKSMTIDSGSPLVVRCHRIGTNLLKMSFRFILEGRARAFSHGPIVTWNSSRQAPTVPSVKLVVTWTINALIGNYFELY